MSTLLVGFDSAWTASNAGAIVGCVRLDNGTLRELGEPRTVDYPAATDAILGWQLEENTAATLVLLDQPTIVRNATGQRPVENLVGAPVSLRYGGMQPANTARTKMFGKDAPVWGFLSQFGGAADPLKPATNTPVFETYPVLTMIALGWTLPDRRTAGRLPKYNPERRKTFSLSDWRHVCGMASGAFHQRGLKRVAGWIDVAAQSAPPRKTDQDKLDACLCLLVALCLVEQKDCLMIGEVETGYIVVPHAAALRTELEARCDKTGRLPGDWVRVFRLIMAHRTSPVAASLDASDS
jgi:predicted RNase H-like nuclease